MKNEKLSQFQSKLPILIQRKGWLRIVESFTTILLISFVLLIILNRSNITQGEIAEQINDIEYSILREVQLNNTLRAEVLDAPLTDEINWENFDSANGLEKTKNKIESRIPASLDCYGKLCTIEAGCFYENNLNKSIYARSSIISATTTKYSPRELKLFCWEI